jgi:hypothetical protein
MIFFRIRILLRIRIRPYLDPDPQNCNFVCKTDISYRVTAYGTPLSSLHAIAGKIRMGQKFRNFSSKQQQKINVCFGNITFKIVKKKFRARVCRIISRNTKRDNNFAKHENTTSPLYWRRVPSHSSSHSRVMRRSSLIKIDTYVRGEETTTFSQLFQSKNFSYSCFPLK